MQKIKQSFKILFCLPAYTYAHNRNILIQDHKPQAKLVALKYIYIYTYKSKPTHHLKRESSILSCTKAFFALKFGITASFFTGHFSHTHEWPHVGHTEIVKLATVPPPVVQSSFRQAYIYIFTFFWNKNQRKSLTVHSSVSQCYSSLGMTLYDKWFKWSVSLLWLVIGSVWGIFAKFRYSQIHIPHS